MKTFTLVVAALCATLAHAQVIRNGSFEDPGFDLGSGAVTLNDIPQWSLSDSSGVEQTAGVQIFPYNPFFPAPAANGRQALFLSGRTVAQRLTATVIEGSQAVRAQGALYSSISAGSWRMKMFAGGSIENGAVVGGTLIAQALYDETGRPEHTWETVTMEYVAGANDPHLGKFLFISLEQTGTETALIDNLQFDANPVPEPATLGLLALGGLLVKRRRK